MMKKDFEDKRVAKKQHQQSDKNQKRLKRSKQETQKVLDNHDPHKRFRKEVTDEE